MSENEGAAASNGSPSRPGSARKTPGRALKVTVAEAADVLRSLGQERYGAVHAALLGVAAFLVIHPWGILDVTNIAWLQAGDFEFQYLGWAFFRDTPWSWPIADNPRYGMEFGGSILYSDSNPLLALLFKPLSPILPHPFQYFGLWILLCFVLQAVTARQLMALAAPSRLVQLCGALIVTIAPVFVLRQGGHFNLLPHWLLIGAVALCLTPQLRRPILWWGLIVGSSFFIHPYFVPMVVPLWGADWLRRHVVLNRPTVRSFIEPAVIVGAVVALVLGTGVANSPGGSEAVAESLTLPGLGWFSFNALSFFDARPFDWLPYSFFMPDIEQWGDDYEGFLYLGTGGVILFVAALVLSLPVIRKNARLARLAPLAPFALALAGLTVFAFSPNITIGPFRLVTLPWPAPLEWLGETFRSTGRFAWPLYYVLFALPIWVLAQRLSHRTLGALVAFAAVVQVVDSYPGWSYYRDPSHTFVQHGRTWSTDLTSPFWDEAAGRYQAIRFARPQTTYGYDSDVVDLAVANRLATDGVFLTRNSPAAIEAANVRIETMAATGDWPADTLYVLDEEVAARAAAAIDPTRDLFAVIDGRTVIAPGWRACADCVQPDLP